jgi:hypothetical protein
MVVTEVDKMVQLVWMLSTLVVHLFFSATLALSQVAVEEVEVASTINAPTLIHTLIVV